MKRTLVFFVTVALFFGALQAHAISIAIDPSAQSIDLGDAVSVEIIISELGGFVAPSISTFDLDLSFDQTLLSHNSAVFGDPSLGDQLDVFGLGGNPTSATNPLFGVVNLFELSLDLPQELIDNQFGVFTMVTVTFDSLAVGISDLALSVNTLGNAAGEPLTPDSLVPGSITIKAPAGVPEPITGFLVGIGLLALGAVGRNRNAKARAVAM